MIILICYENNLDDYDDFLDDTPQPDILTYETDDLELVLKDIEEKRLTERYEQIEVCIVERTIKSEIIKSQTKATFEPPPISEAEKELDKLEMELVLELLRSLPKHPLP